VRDDAAGDRQVHRFAVVDIGPQGGFGSRLAGLVLAPEVDFVADVEQTCGRSRGHAGRERQLTAGAATEIDVGYKRGARDARLDFRLAHTRYCRGDVEVVLLPLGHEVRQFVA